MSLTLCTDPPSVPLPLSDGGAGGATEPAVASRPSPARNTLPSPRRAGGHTPPAACQWIAGEPSEDDGCKCGRPVLAGKPYCPAHARRAYLAADPDWPALFALVRRAR